MNKFCPNLNIVKQGKVDGAPSKRMPPPGQSDISQPKTLSQGNIKASSNESFFGGKKGKFSKVKGHEGK